MREDETPERRQTVRLFNNEHNDVQLYLSIVLFFIILVKRFEYVDVHVPLLSVIRVGRVYWSS